ncbi:MAG TPA: translation initiation factor IF-2 [Chthoniobacteraceae bacterium]|jgi:translation initiation factor IF-2|nr:infB [Chthoniobacter sp.]HEV7869066.1 translation initiation factor IF-2 [Chthoniobacteraceae bacterium]
MPTKTTPKTSAKKGDAAKSGRPGNASRLPAKAPAAAEAAKPVEPPAPKVPKEVLSLIEPKTKTIRKRTQSELDNKAFGALPSISKLLEPEPVAPPPAREPAPAPAEAAVIEAPVAEPEAPAEDLSKIIHLKPPFSVKDLANAMGIKPFQVISDLMEQNIFASINQSIETEIASRICTKHGFVFEKEKRKEGGGVHKVVEVVAPPPEPEKPKDEELTHRAPIVTFMGHVDHGKTTLMDAIRKTRVAAGEAGGITQHIGAYSVEHGGQRITFLDTPGHAAFTAMRARGANVTDVVVLVIAADDGLMPQTIEALNHAQAAKVKIIIAITKIDVPGANLDKVKGQLQEKGLVPEDWGGDTIVCPVSAIKGIGIDKLLESITLESEMLELKASREQSPRGSVIEAQIEQGRGPTATVIVKVGTLKAGQSFICGRYSGKIKSLMDEFGKPMKEAGPSMPCKVLGFSGLPNAGDELLVMSSERDAQRLSEERLAEERVGKLSTPQRATLENLFNTLADEARKRLTLILKADVQGSLEALVTALRDINSKKIDLDLVHTAVGPITENDILLASASNAVVIGFNVKTESSAAITARREGVQIKLFSIIYELIDQVKESMAGLLDPETRETQIGHAEVKKVFELSRGLVAGCLVTDGRISRTARARVLRGRQPIYDGGLATLRRFQDDVKEVRSGLECGIKLGDFNDYEVGDIIECYTLENFAQKL